MPRVNKVEKAAKDQPDYGIEKGDTYYWWKFRFGGKRVSKTFPKASQLTQSEYLSEIYSIHEDFADTEDGDLRDAIPDLVNRIRECGEGCQERLDNMPEGLQQGSTGEMLQERLVSRSFVAEQFARFRQNRERQHHIEQRRGSTFGIAVHADADAVEWRTHCRDVEEAQAFLENRKPIPECWGESYSANARAVASASANHNLPKPLTGAEHYLLQNGICSFDCSSGVSTDELNQCAEAVVSLVKESMEKAEAPRMTAQNVKEQTPT